MPEKNWRTEFAKIWVKYWTAPARPTVGSLAFLRSKIVEFHKTNPAVLVLGSTSEFRDMMIELGIRPTVVDFSRDNYDILSGAMKYKDRYRENEEYVEADWRTMDLGRQFDIIVTDAALNVVPKDSNRQLLSNVAKHLSPDGIFIGRIHQVPPRYDTFNFFEEVKKHKKDIDERSLYEVFGTPMYYAVQKKENEPIPLQEVAKLSDECLLRGLITREQYDEYRRLGKHDAEGFVFFLPTAAFVEERVREFSMLSRHVLIAIGRFIRNFIRCM